MKTTFIAGQFDLIHPGYILAFKEAKAYGENLIVALHVDPSKERLSKIGPVHSLFERKLMLESMKEVDQILVYETEADLKLLLKIWKPHFRILGDEYKEKIEQITGYEIDKQNHTKYIFIDRSHRYSTTALKKKIYNQMKEYEND